MRYYIAVVVIFILVIVGVVMPAVLRPSNERILNYSLAIEGREPREDVYYILDHKTRRLIMVDKFNLKK